MAASAQRYHLDPQLQRLPRLVAADDRELEATGKAHPDPKVAKAARKAAFKIRSSDGA